MAKDDYFVISYKILVYLYAVLKRDLIYDEKVFLKTVRGAEINEGYFTDILHMMTEEGLIAGLTFTTAWGSEHILISDLSDMRITVEGISYLHDNSKMKHAGDILKDSADIFVSLAIKVLGI